ATRRSRRARRRAARCRAARTRCAASAGSPRPRSPLRATCPARVPPPSSGGWRRNGAFALSASSAASCGTPPERRAQQVDEQLRVEADALRLARRALLEAQVVGTLEPSQAPFRDELGVDRAEAPLERRVDGRAE